MSQRGIVGLQRHWYRITPWHLLLLPLSLLFHLIIATRRLLFRGGILSSVKLPVPVIIAVVSAAAAANLRRCSLVAIPLPWEMSQC
jgi:hypothetical protein